MLSHSRGGAAPLEVALIAVGAMLVGSIIETKKEGDVVARGEELGYFAYGGSTVIVVLPPGTTRFDEDLLTNSKNGIETAVRVGDRIGQLI